MNKRFGIIATQNPNKGAFANKRKDLGIGFLSRFQKINFPNFTKEELIDITKGLAKQNNYIDNDEFLTDIVSFHMDWQEETNLIDDVQCFTIREIEGVIRALAQNKNKYDTIMTVYGARYSKKMKEKLKEKLKNYKTLKTLQPSKLSLPEEFPACYSNNNLCEAVSSILFSLRNERNAIIVGEDESGITQVAKWSAKEDFSFYTPCDILKKKLFSEEKMNEKSLINMQIEFKPGLILSAILNKKSLILKDMPQVKTIVLERFNELFSGKHNLTLVEDIPGTLTTKEEKELRDFNKDFRVIATCKPGDELKLSEALLSRFTVIACEAYNEEEEQVVLESSAAENEDINKIKKFAPNFNLSELLNCLEICKRLDNLNEDMHETNLNIALYILQKGLIEQRNI